MGIIVVKREECFHFHTINMKWFCLFYAMLGLSYILVYDEKSGTRVKQYNPKTCYKK